MMGARLQSDVSAGVAGRKGNAVQALDDEAGTPTAMGTFGAEFEAAPFNAVKGNAKGGSLHAGAPDNGGGSPQMPGSVPLTAHHFMANPAKGNSPKRSAGKTTGTDEATRRKLSEAGA